MNPLEIKKYYIRKCEELEDKVLKILFFLICEKQILILRNFRKVDIVSKFLPYAQKNWSHNHQKNQELIEAINLLNENGFTLFINNYLMAAGQKSFNEFKNLLKLNHRINLSDLLKIEIEIYNGKGVQKMQLFDYFQIIVQSQEEVLEKQKQLMYKLKVDQTIIDGYLNFKEKLIYDLKDETKANKAINFANGNLRAIDNFISLTYQQIQNYSTWKFPHKD